VSRNIAKTHVSSRSSASSAYTWGIFQRLQIQGVEKLGRSKSWNAGIGLWPPGCAKIGDFGMFNQLKMVNFMMANGDHIMLLYDRGTGKSTIGQCI